MASSNQLNFPFSDLIAGYIRSVSYPDVFDCKGEVELETSDGRMYTVKITDAAYAELVRNLGEPFQMAPDLSQILVCLLYTSPSPRDGLLSRMPSSA